MCLTGGSGLNRSLVVVLAPNHFLVSDVAAIREGKQAVELYPMSVDAWNGDYLVRNLARIYLLIGNQNAAIEQLEILLSVPSLMTAARLRLDPIWDPLRDHPRFQALLERYEQ